MKHFQFQSKLKRHQQSKSHRISAERRTGRNSEKTIVNYETGTYKMNFPLLQFLCIDTESEREGTSHYDSSSVLSVFSDEDNIVYHK